MGDVSPLVDQAHKARNFYERAHEIAQQLKADFPTDTQARRLLSISCDRLGEVSLKADQVREAREFYQQALDLRKKLLAANRNDAQAQRDVWYSYICLGNVSLRSDETAEALNFYKQALDIAQALAAPDRDDAWAQETLAYSYIKLAKASLKADQVQKALNFYQLGLDIEARLVAADPDNARARRRLSFTYNSVGDVHLKKKNEVQKALEYYRKALDIRKKLANRNPNDALPARDLIVSFNKMGNTSMRALEVKEALGFYQEAFKLNWAKTVRRFRFGTEKPNRGPRPAQSAAELETQYDIDKLAQDAAEVRAMAHAKFENKAARLYTTACSYGLCAALLQPAQGKTLTEKQQSRRKEYLELSLACLKEAIAAGYSDFEHARKDSSLAALQELPEFQKLVNHRMKRQSNSVRVINE